MENLNFITNSNKTPNIYRVQIPITLITRLFRVSHTDLCNQKDEIRSMLGGAAKVKYLGGGYLEIKVQPENFKLFIEELRQLCATYNQIQQRLNMLTEEEIADCAKGVYSNDFIKLLVKELVCRITLTDSATKEKRILCKLYNY